MGGTGSGIHPGDVEDRFALYLAGGEGKYALIYDAMLLLSLQLPIPLLVMAVQLVLLKRMLVIQDQRMALDQGRTKPPIQWFISLHAHVFASDLPRCSHRYSPAQSNILYMYD